MATTLASGQEIKLPTPVQAAVDRERQGAPIDKIARQTDGKWYEIRFHVSGRENRISVDNSGAVIEYRDEIPIDVVPAPARAAVAKAVGRGQIEGIWRYIRGKSVFYKIHFSAGGKKNSIRVESDGTVLSQREAPLGQP
jgi:hypothetical protein